MPRTAEDRSLAGHLRAASPKIVALIYTGGTAAHVFRLAVGCTWRDMPFFVDWILVVLGPVGAVGLVWLKDEVLYRGWWEKATHWLIVVHLSVSVAVHLWILVAGSHEVLSVFPYGYSYLGVVYFAFFAWRSWTLRLRPA
jgi:hypothetical protein